MALEQIKIKRVMNETVVLILVLMEWRWNKQLWQKQRKWPFVLILVLMEWRWNKTKKLWQQVFKSS